ncbi:DEBR0S1_24652g1_1 [Brettanomyces bruxellensis]|uniref:DEBR0S1_24652g1_1 n=1 Tax=Dekkera bruxellensis TaxID=5007 RepID=A0A7D9GZQ4_DEKBR|nr:DEBR0S1_24652g1_1 [Brettanomyces bruxellensis]
MVLVGFRDKIRKSQDWSLGLFFLLCVVLLWVLSSFLLNDLFEKGIYSKPFLITWINTSAFTFYLIPYYLRYHLNKLSENSPIVRVLSSISSSAGQESRDQNDINDDIEAEAEAFDAEAANIESSNENNDNISMSGTSALIIVDSHKPEPLTFLETIHLSFWFCILWFVSNLLNNASLIFTSVSSQTILASTSSFFTIVIGYFTSLELLSKTKLISIALSIAGIILVTSNDNPVKNEAAEQAIMWGNLLALAGALCYGVYSILLKLNVKEDSRIDMKLFFGFVGLFNFLLLWPPLIIMNKLGYERLELPPNKSVYIIIIFNCIASFLADFLWARAMLLTSPLTVTVGLSMTIPVAMVCDFIFNLKWNSSVYIIGAMLICASFYMVNKDEQNDNNQRID